MNILFITSSKERMPYPVFPLGASYVVESLLNKGHNVKVLDMLFEDTEVSAINREIKKEIYDISVISVRNIDNCAYPDTVFYIDKVKEIVNVLHEKGLSVVIGGSGFSVMPMEIYKYTGVDYGIAGEGEISLPNLLYELVKPLDQRNLSNISGLIYKWKGEVKENSIIVNELSGNFFPKRELFRVDDYWREGGMMNIQTKKGCPFKCIYCTYPMLEGKHIRFRDQDEVIAEMKYLKEKWGITYFFFVDDIFNYPLDYASEICEKIIESNLNIQWTCFAHPKYITDDFVELAARSGCMGFEFGTDSLNDKVLHNLRKGFNYADVKKSSMICKKHQLKYCHYLLLGGPGENLETLKETFERAAELDSDAFIVLTGLRVYPGTHLYNIAKKEGKIKSLDILKPIFYISHDVEGIITDYVSKEGKDIPGLVYSAAKLNYNEKHLDIARKFGIKGPLWDYIKK